MPYINCTVFKPSGKYYTDEMVYYSDCILADYQIPSEICKNRSMPSMFYLGKTIESEVPFLIIPEDK